MKKIITNLLILFTTIQFSFSQQFEWVKSYGGTSSISQLSLVADNSGNIYAVGRFTGQIDFDPGAGTFNLTSNGSFDAYIQKLDPNGNFLWAKSFGGTLLDVAHSIAIDASGNVFTTGFFQGLADFDPGSGVVNLSSNGSNDAFIQKLDSSGNLIWAKSFGGTSSLIPNSIALDFYGNIYTSGKFEGIADFNPGVGTVNITSNGSSDVYIQKLDTSGNFVWAKSFGAYGDDQVSSMVVDRNGNIYSTGRFYGTVNFDPGPATFNLTSNGSSDVFIQKLNSSGNFVWAKSFGGTSNDDAKSIAIDRVGDIYSTGRFSGAVDFDPGVGTVNLTSNGSSDVYLQKLNFFGNLVWAKSYGGTSNDEPSSIAIDASSNIYTTGNFRGAADFDPGLGSTRLGSTGSADIFIQKLNSSGNFVWAKSFGGNTDENDNGYFIVANGSFLYTSGAFSGIIDFDPGTGTVNLKSNTSYDVFIQKLNSSGNFIWAKSLVGNSCVNNYSTLDAQGNIYNVGVFEGTVDFDPGTGTANLTSNGLKDVFIQKLNSSGDFIWAKSFGGLLNDEANSIAIDALGNIYSTGIFLTTVDFDPGIGTFYLTSNAAVSNIFIQKLSSSGNFIWAKSFGGNRNDYSYSINVDRSGNIYTSGTFINTVDFDPGSGVFNLTDDDGRVFIQKLNSSGNFIWAKCYGGKNLSSGKPISLKTDFFGSIYTIGEFTGTVDFGPGAGIVNLTSNGSTDVFVQKLTSSGNLVWAKSFGGSSYDQVASISVDASGNVYTTGNFTGTVDFDPGSGTVNLTSNGSFDVFIQKLNSSGNFVWAKSFGGTSGDVASSLALDASGNIYTTGSFGGTSDFDPGAGTVNLTSNGSSDVFIQKLNSSGNFVWAKSYGGTSSDDPSSIAIDGSRNIYTTGTFGGTVDFDPGPGVVNLSANDGRVFIQKISQCTTTTGTAVITACDSYTWINGVTYTASNSSAKDTLTNAAGCDSIVTLNLTINNSNTGTDVQTACDSYTWINGVTYTSSNNTATDTLTNTNGCDSVVTLNLTINNSNTGVDVQTACDSYTWINGVTYTSSNNTATQTLTNAAGCDSVVTLNLTINTSTSGTDVQTACDSYTWINGVTYTSSNNTATQTLTNAQGCDSVVTLNLTINNSNTGVDVQTACDSYTWINGVTYTSSNNTATDTLTNAQGCDSVVTLNLTINPAVAITSQPVNQTVFVGGNAQFQVTASGIGLTYQWQEDDGSGYSDITSTGIYSGTTTNTLTITGVNASIQQNGYRCKIFNSTGCSDTTVAAILYISLTIIDENGVEKSFKLFPNPTTSELNIESSITYSSGSIINALGQTVMQFKNETTLDVSNLKTGNYILLIKGENNEVIKTEKFNKY